EQRRLQIRIACNLTEICHTRQSVRDSRAVIIRKAMVAAALYVEGGEIETAGARRTKQKITQVADYLRVNGLSIVGCEIFKDRIGSAFLQRIRIKERVIQVELFADRIAVVVQKLHIVINEGVANSIRGS